jgi:VWFA-related protein
MRLLCCICLPCAAIGLLAQTPSTPKTSSPTIDYAAPSFQTTTRNVVLDAVVLDHKGDVVNGLARKDFVIREDGAPQTIQSFDAVTAGNSTLDATPHTVLLVDEMNTRFEDFAYARYSIGRLVRKDGVRLAQPTALYLLGNDGLHVLQSYTRDPATIDAAFQRHRPVLSWRLEQRSFYNALDRINLSLTALQQIAIANTGVAGRKNIVWISPGFPIFSGLQYTADAQQELFHALRRLSNQLLRARISIYSVDPRGVEAGAANLGTPSRITNNLEFMAYINSLSQAQDMTFGNLAIQTLATQTGGHAFFGRNDVDREIATSLTQGNSYYTLAYAPANRNFDGKFRKIKVTIIGRPDLKVQTRDGYYAMPEGQQPDLKQQIQELTSLLVAPIPFNGVPIPESYTTLLESPQRVSVRLAMPSTSLSWTAGAKGKLTAQVTVAAADKDKHGAWNPQFARVYEVELPDGMTPSSTQLGTISFEMPYNKSDHMRFVVRDDPSGRVGSAEIDLKSLKTSGS